ncbi:MAG: BA14K family protein, partial [Pseudomonadota bacterium]
RGGGPAFSGGGPRGGGPMFGGGGISRGGLAGGAIARGAPVGPRVGGGNWQGGGGPRWHGGGGRHWHGGWHGRRGYWSGVGIGVIGSPYYYGSYGDPYYYGYYDEPTVTVVPDDDDRTEAYCRRRFKSYDPASGTYLGYDGKRHPCP